MKKTEKLTRVRLDELGLYLQTIYQEYGSKTNQEYADLVQEHFKVECTVHDIEFIEDLEHHKKQLDYELISRREEYFRSQGLSNFLDYE
jgi:hypothetical protein